MSSMSKPALATGPGVPYATADELRGRETFLALMGALSRPGQPYELPAHAVDSMVETIGACVLVAEALLDLETTFFSPDPGLSRALARTGARAVAAARAAYQFYPALDAAALPTVEAAAIGDHLYPDRAATLVVGCRLGMGRLLQLHGPGIRSARELRVDELPAAFWTLRNQRTHYPLGWDLLLVDGAHVVGLPRTTAITLAKEGI